MTDRVDLEQAEHEAKSESEAEAADDAAVDLQALIDNDEDDIPTPNEYSVAFSPRNVAVGLAIVAGLVGLLVRRRRGGKSGLSG
ncbi:MAG: hypothetical protein H0U52_14205 [Chloroflexi bacterium]|nr:hypothetical protein [Chloroflexota bacterium]